MMQSHKAMYWHDNGIIAVYNLGCYQYRFMPPVLHQKLRCYASPSFLMVYEVFFGFLRTSSGLLSRGRFLTTGFCAGLNSELPPNGLKFLGGWTTVTFGVFLSTAGASFISTSLTSADDCRDGLLLFVFAMLAGGFVFGREGSLGASDIETLGARELERLAGKETWPESLPSRSLLVGGAEATGVVFAAGASDMSASGTGTGLGCIGFSLGAFALLGSVNGPMYLV
jgi:hypothetical protein